MTIEDQLNILVLYHFEEHVSVRHMLPVLEQHDFARENIAPKGGINKSSFSKAISSRGLKQILIKAKATKTVVQKNGVKVDGIFFYDTDVRSGTEENNSQSQAPVRLVGYRVDRPDYRAKFY